MSAVTASRPALRPVIARLRAAGYEVLGVGAGSKHLRMLVRSPDGLEVVAHVLLSREAARQQAATTLAQIRRNTEARRARSGTA